MEIPTIVKQTEQEKPENMAQLSPAPTLVPVTDKTTLPASSPLCLCTLDRYGHLDNVA